MRKDLWKLMNERERPSFKVNLDEDFETYFLRVCSHKLKDDLTWKDIANIINHEWFRFKASYSSDHYRKLFYKLRDNVLEQSEEINELKDIIEEKQEKYKISDMLTQTNANMRRLSREDTIKELGVIAAQIIAKDNPFKFNEPLCKVKFDKTGILQLSDWHYGIDINNPYNKYNPEEAKLRLNVLINKVIKLCDEQLISKLVVLNLGDLVAGRIHLPIRLNSRIDVITQIMSVSEMLAQALFTLSKHVSIEYFSVIDNHSRLDPNKKDAIQLESLARITDWYLEERFKNCSDVIIHPNKDGKDILTFKVFNYNFAGVHGDLDSPSKIVENVSLMTKQHYDVIFSSHMHHWSLNEETQTVVISNPSLMGTDELAVKLRKNSKPAQNLTIVTPDNPVYMLCRILVD